MNKKVFGFILVLLALVIATFYFDLVDIDNITINNNIILLLIGVMIACIIFLRYFDYLIHVFNPGLVLTVLYLLYLIYGMSISELFSMSHNIISLIIGLVILSIYGVYTSYTSSKPTNYNEYSQGVFDIVNDVIRLIVLTSVLFSWGFCLQFLPNEIYIGAILFLLVILVITFFEFYMTTKNALITMQRIDPTQLQNKN